MTDIDLLQEKISGSGYKLEYIAKACGETYQALRPKLKGLRDFDQTEIGALKGLLNLSNDDINVIFFGGV